jgi:hypothetical protein
MYNRSNGNSGGNRVFAYAFSFVSQLDELAVGPMLLNVLRLWVLGRLVREPGSADAAVASSRATVGNVSAFAI